jgi:hypothetical protein
MRVFTMYVQPAAFEAPQKSDSAVGTIANEGATLSSPASRSAYAAMTATSPDAANAHYGAMTIVDNSGFGKAGKAPVNTQY